MYRHFHFSKCKNNTPVIKCKWHNDIVCICMELLKLEFLLLFVPRNSNDTAYNKHILWNLNLKIRVDATTLDHCQCLYKYNNLILLMFIVQRLNLLNLTKFNYGRWLQLCCMFKGRKQCVSYRRSKNYFICHIFRTIVEQQML